MNIKKTLAICLNSLGYHYGCNIVSLTEFLEYQGTYKNKCKKAIRIINDLMVMHGKKNLSNHVVELGRVEYATRGLKVTARDHVVHALNAFILGIYISENYFSHSIGIVDEFQWKVACLFHDIGYPLEIANGICKSFMQTIAKTKDNLDIIPLSPPVWVMSEDLFEISGAKNSIQLIMERIKEWELDDKRIIEYAKKINFCDHGIYSAALLMHTIDLVYQKYNPLRKREDIYIPGTRISCNQECFENDIVSACTAIFLHNLPGECFIAAKIKKDIAPIAFLLKLSDTLQEWNRPSLQNPKGYKASSFDISIDYFNNLVLTTTLDMFRVNRIECDIESCLDADDIIIRRV